MQKEEKIKKLKQIVKELRSSAAEIGEDGDMTCVARTPEIAARKFIAYEKHVVGDWEGRELRDNIKIGKSFILKGYLHLFTDEDLATGEYDDAEWYVNESDVSDYPVFILRR